MACDPTASRSIFFFRVMADRNFHILEKPFLMICGCALLLLSLEDDDSELNTGILTYLICSQGIDLLIAFRPGLDSLSEFFLLSARRLI